MKAVLEDAERKKEETERLSVNLAKYLPPQVHEAIFSGEFDTGITTKRRKLTIFLVISQILHLPRRVSNRKI